MVRRVRLLFAGGVEVVFVDRDEGLRFVEWVCERGTRFPVIVYGPEGCGKTAFLRQAAVVLEDAGYHVVYLDPLAGVVDRALKVSPGIKGIVLDVLRSVGGSMALLVEAVVRVAELVVERIRFARLALLLDDVFQVIGLERVEAYVKSLLNFIEYPPAEYERIVVLVASSEGVSRARVGRHRWARMLGMWNLARRGFEELYSQIPSPKPPIDEVWRATGGNPAMLAHLLEAEWRIDAVVRQLARERRLGYLIKTLSDRQRELLIQALEDPDTIWRNLSDPEARDLLTKLIETNMIAELWDRAEEAWIDAPPPEKDLELGIGRHLAWQTPIHREALRKAVEEAQ